MIDNILENQLRLSISLLEHRLLSYSETSDGSSSVLREANRNESC